MKSSELAEKYMAVEYENSELATKLFNEEDSDWQQNHVEYLSKIIDGVAKCVISPILAEPIIVALTSTLKATYLHGYMAGKASNEVKE